MNRTLSGATTQCLSGLGNDGNEGVLHITGTSPSDYLVSYLGGGGLTPLQSLIPIEFFTLFNAGGLSHESQWQLVTSDL